MRQIRYGLVLGMVVWLAGCGTPTNTATNQVVPDVQTGAQQSAGASGMPEANVPALAPVQPNAEQQAAMQDPQQVAQLFAESLKQERYEAVEPLMNDEVRTRLALGSAEGSVAAYYRERQAGMGKLVEYNIFNQHTVYDSDDLVAFDLDFKYERQLNQGKMLLTRSESGWLIAGIEDRTQPSLAEVQPNDEQRQAMQDPAEVARVFAEGLKQKQYDQVEALFSYFARQTFGPPGSIAEHYRESARRYGNMLDYSLGETRMQPDDFAEIDVSFIHEQGQMPSKVVLKKTPQGWKISRVVAQQS